MSARIRQRIDRLTRLVAEAAAHHAPPGRDAERIRNDMARLMADPDAMELAGRLGELAIDLGVDFDAGNVLEQLASDPRAAEMLARLDAAMEPADTASFDELNIAPEGIDR